MAEMAQEILGNIVSNLVKMLRKAHSGELAAYHAYEGHWKSVSDLAQQKKIQKIQEEELEHRKIVANMLKYLESRPSLTRDTIFMVFGHALGFLCHYTGWFLPMKVALLIEEIGVVSYWDMLDCSLMEGHPELTMTFLAMAKTEEEHKKYFSGLLDEKIQTSSNQRTT